eukprot:GHVQ01038695.1.p1 GENE.GHVQ01038695.1~~GHVQ01038695.1.p1  ORF type:complete len:117 (+),score=0.82 GHVQ01038695.1:1087-1437(+)
MGNSCNIVRRAPAELHTHCNNISHLVCFVVGSFLEWYTEGESTWGLALIWFLKTSSCSLLPQFWLSSLISFPMFLWLCALHKWTVPVPTCTALEYQCGESWSPSGKNDLLRSVHRR